MPRYPRSYLNTSFFHIMTQGINKSYIFDNAQDINYYINKMNDLANKHDVEILAYCIMNNHAHILIKTNQISELSKYMQRLNTTYAIYYNKKYNKVGFVFRNRYKAEGIYEENHLYGCIKYIANNPVKAGICKFPEEYLYSKFPNFKQVNDEDYFFIDTAESDERFLKGVISKFLLDNNMTLKELNRNKEKLKMIVVLLKEKYKVSFRKIAIMIESTKDIVRRTYYNK